MKSSGLLITPPPTWPPDIEVVVNLSALPSFDAVTGTPFFDDGDLFIDIMVFPSREGTEPLRVRAASGDLRKLRLLIPLIL